MRSMIWQVYLFIVFIIDSLNLVLMWVNAFAEYGHSLATQTVIQPHQFQFQSYFSSLYDMLAIGLSSITMLMKA